MSQLIVISRSLITEDCLVNAGHVLVRCVDNQWRFLDPHNQHRGQQRGRVVHSDQRTVTINLEKNER